MSAIRLDSVTYLAPVAPAPLAPVSPAPASGATRSFAVRDDIDLGGASEAPAHSWLREAISGRAADASGSLTGLGSSRRQSLQERIAAEQRELEAKRAEAQSNDTPWEAIGWLFGDDGGAGEAEKSIEVASISARARFHGDDD